MSPQTKNQARKFPLKRVIVAAVAAAVLLFCLFVGLFPTMLLPAYAIPALREGEVRLHFLDVGQGDCTLLEFSDELFVLDSGSGSFEANRKLVRYVEGLAPKRITLLLTHADADHYGGFSVLLRTFEVDACYLPLLPAEGKKYEALLAAVEREGCKTGILTRGDLLREEEGYLVCLSPFADGEKDANDSSVVLYLELGGVTALLCGDISETRERLLVDEYIHSPSVFDGDGCPVRLDGIDILKAPHHASAYSSSREFLELLRPETYVVTCGRDNVYKLPAGGALQRFREASPGGAIYRTDELGDLIVSVKNKNYTVTAR